MVKPEGVFRVAVIDHEADVDDAGAGGGGRWGRGGNCFLGALLNEGDEVAFGIANAELTIGEREFGQDVVGIEVALELGGVAGGEGDGGKVGVGPRGRRRGFRSTGSD